MFKVRSVFYNVFKYALRADSELLLFDN